MTTHPDGWTETVETHPLAPEERFKVKVMINGDRKMVIDKATKAWFKYGPEELNRQFEEQRIHDDLGYAWSRIRPEAPVHMGSERRYADIVVLRNEHNGLEPTNYLEIFEIKRTGADLQRARAQLISYLSNSSAVRGVVSDIAHAEALIKTRDGKIIPQSELTFGKRFSAEDLLAKSEVKLIHVDTRMYSFYCNEMRRLLGKIPQSSEQARMFVQFWRDQVSRVEKVRERSRDKIWP